jgi:hypothetical protein
MALHNIMFLCGDCGRFHATKLSVSMIDGPDRRKQIDEVYSINEIPSEVTKFNKAGQEGTLSRPDRLNMIHAVFSKRTGDQGVALMERVWDSEGRCYGLHDGGSDSRALRFRY